MVREVTPDCFLEKICKHLDLSDIPYQDLFYCAKTNEIQLRGIFRFKEMENILISLCEYIYIYNIYIFFS